MLPGPDNGVTVIVATTGTLEVLVAVKLAILPVPLAARPMEGLLLVQLYVVPAKIPLKTTLSVREALHKVWLATGLTEGIGFTVKVWNDDTGLPQPEFIE